VGLLESSQTTDGLPLRVDFSFIKQMTEEQALKEHPEDETVWLTQQISGLLFLSTIL
jgi:hypothetical protein